MGRLDRLARLYRRRESMPSEDWRDLQHVFATLDRLLADTPEARAALHAVISKHRLRPDDPPRLEYPGYLDIAFLGDLRASLAPHCDLEALAEALGGRVTKRARRECMSNEPSSHQRLAAYYAGQHETWADLQAEARARGLSVMEVARERAAAEAARHRDATERAQALLERPAVRRALAEGRMPTPDELATSDASAAPRQFDAGAFEEAYHHRFGRWPSGAEHDDERRRIERGEPSLLAEYTPASPSAGRAINPPKPRR